MQPDRTDVVPKGAPWPGSSTSSSAVTRLIEMGVEPFLVGSVRPGEPAGGELRRAELHGLLAALGVIWILPE